MKERTGRAIIRLNYGFRSFTSRRVNLATNGGCTLNGTCTLCGKWYASAEMGAFEGKVRISTILGKKGIFKTENFAKNDKKGPH